MRGSAALISVPLATLTGPVGRSSVPMRARIATPDERAELWPRVTAKYRNYAGYQRRTDREIPLVLIEPER